jgi:RNA 2',3'-cyclic 3'-phosphodiesterase
VRYASGDWHVTLHFLGRVSADQVDGLANGANLDFDPFECVLDRPQIWGRGLAVLCPSEVPAPWLALHDRLGLMLGGLGFPSDPRSYRPHLTLARHAAGASPPQRQMPITWPVRSFALVASTGHDNPRYEVVRVYDQTA